MCACGLIARLWFLLTAALMSVQIDSGGCSHSIRLWFSARLLACACLPAESGHYIACGFKIIKRRFVRALATTFHMGRRYDASTVLFVVMEAANEYSPTAASLQNLFVWYAIATVAVHAVMFGLWNANSEYDEASCARWACLRRHGGASYAVVDVMDEEGTAASVVPAVPAAVEVESAGYIPVAARPFSRQIRSREFVFIVLNTLVCGFRADVYLTSVGDYCASIGDASDGNLYQKSVAIIVPLGVVFVPAVSWVLTRYGLRAGAWMVFALGVGYEGCVLVESLPMQLLGAILFTFFRAALYTNVAAFCAGELCNAVALVRCGASCWRGATRRIWPFVCRKDRWDSVFRERSRDHGNVPSFGDDCGRLWWRLSPSASFHAESRADYITSHAVGDCLVARVASSARGVPALWAPAARQGAPRWLRGRA